MSTAAAALSVHPVAAAALGEVAGGVLERLDSNPDVAVIVAGGAHAASLGSITEAVRELLTPGCLMTVAASGTLGGGTAAPTIPSVALWAATDTGAEPVPPALLAGPDAAVGLPASGTLVVAATGGHHLPRLVETLAVERPGLAVVGGLMDPGPPSSGRVGLDGATDDAIAGFVLPPGVATATSAGAVRPIGEAMVVTEATGPVVATLAGSPAADRFDETVAMLAPERRSALRNGVFLCRVVDERGTDPGPSDIVAHGIRGLVAGSRALAVDAGIEVGTLVRFGYLDPEIADAQLRTALVGASGGRPSAGALLFSCVARGAGMFSNDDLDAVVTSEALGTTAVAGAFCAGEVGPRGPRSWLVGYTATALVLHAGGPPTLG